MVKAINNYKQILLFGHLGGLIYYRKLPSCLYNRYFLNFYNITFYRPEKQGKRSTQNHGKLKKELYNLDWIYALEKKLFYQ
ncbi:hypothetical protein BST83_07080 [Polaribacter filamentus]|uniref:Uncharacterized protein n=1 Tax=Polaribacter filamentus TaxID=53483 RepID=A0A2S7KWQ9_9FLAO|nr:hypothetical protein BST83_07080 [Polaribacter filamentus]